MARGSTTPHTTTSHSVSSGRRTRLTGVAARRAWATGLTFTVGALTLVGCTGNNPGPEWTPTPATPVSHPSTTPSPDPATVKPDRPAAMNTADEAGAEAAARYFIALYGYAFATGDTTELDGLSDPACVYCSNVMDGIVAQRAVGAHTSGGAIEVGTVESVEVTPGTFYTVRLEGQQAPWSVIDAEGTVVDHSDASSTPYLFTFAITYAVDTWAVREVQFDALAG